MRVQYLGTAAAEGFPALFCRCAACNRAIEEGGKNLRTRASVLVNGHLLIDLSPDVLGQRLAQGLDLAAVDTLCVTHSHSDHLAAAELTRRSTANYCHIPGETPMRVYGNARAAGLARAALETEFGSREDPSLSVTVLRPWDSIDSGELRVTAVPARHDPSEDCFLYLVEEHGGEALLYANDTALPPAQTLRGLAERLGGKMLDYVSMDCTHGLGRGSDRHMGAEENHTLKCALEALGCAGPATRFIATHFSHNGNILHWELVEGLVPLGIVPAWDGAVFGASAP